ncbi:hypothetical protein CKF96_03885 (plasmid) [Priestia filamentosa]|nr:hypothetical protein CKF96_03885 [Priestia filamentosa]
MGKKWKRKRRKKAGLTKRKVNGSVPLTFIAPIYAGYDACILRNMYRQVEFTTFTPFAGK